MSAFKLAPDEPTRRSFFEGAGLRAGSVALGLLAASRASAAPGRVHPPVPGLPHHKPTAKALIYLHMNGAPSQIDTWDHKPVLKEYFNKDLPQSVRGGQRLSTMTSGQQRFPVAPSKFTFQRMGKCGTWANTDILPYTARIVDDIAVIKTVHTNAINHDPACTFVMTGSEVPGKASIGSWLAYGLGSESNNLPAFVVFTPRFPDGSNGQALFTRMWSSGFLPTAFNGVALRGAGDPVLYLRNPEADFELELTINKDQTTPYDLGTGYGHIAFVVDDLAAEHARFTALGFEPRNMVEFNHQGALLARFFFVQDPDGYKIEMIEKHGRFR